MTVACAKLQQCCVCVCVCVCVFEVLTCCQNVDKRWKTIQVREGTTKKFWQHLWVRKRANQKNFHVPNSSKIKRGRARKNLVIFKNNVYSKNFPEKFTTEKFTRKIHDQKFCWKKTMTKHFLEKITTFQNFPEFRYSEIFQFQPEMKRGGGTWKFFRFARFLNNRMQHFGIFN